MVDRGNKDAHRYSMSGLDVVEKQKWGRDKARERVGSVKFENGAPPPSGKLQKVQSPADRHAPGYDNDTPGNWLRAAGEDATSKPNFDRDNPWRKSRKAY